jgi:hypothetical protein
LLAASSLTHSHYDFSLGLSSRSFILTADMSATQLLNPKAESRVWNATPLYNPSVARTNISSSDVERR